MTLTVVPARSLTPDLVAAWSDVQRAYPDLASPFFRPEYTQGVAAIQGGVEVIVFEADGAPAAFLPFQRQGAHTATRVGGKICDYQGVIGDPAVAWDVRAAMRAANLKSWFFDHQVAGTADFESATYRRDESPYIDLSRGAQSYFEEVQTSLFKTTRRKLRRLGRNVGPLRYEPYSTDAAIFDQVIAWKSEQIRTTKGPSILDDRVIVDTIRHLFESRTPEFGAVLSTLHAGDELIAADIDLLAGGCHHGWLPTYDRAYQRESPGLCLMLVRIDEAETHGITRIDMGKGPEPYKRTLMNGATPLLEGCIDMRPGIAGMKRAVYSIRNRVLASPLRKPLRVVARRAAAVAPGLKNVLWMR